MTAETMARLLQGFSLGVLDGTDRAMLADALRDDGRDAEADLVAMNPHKSRVVFYTDWDSRRSAIRYLEQKPDWMSWDAWDPTDPRPEVPADAFDLFADEVPNG
jgi:hypothetical protein